MDSGHTPLSFRLHIRLSTAKKIGIAIGTMTGATLTWTGWTGPELLSRIAVVPWLSFFGSDWFRTVLLIAGLGLIGSMTFIGLRSVPATLETVTIPIGEGDRAEAYGIVKPPATDLRELLEEELRKGENLRQRLPGPFGSAITAVLMGQTTHEDDVDWWEDRIEALLKPYPFKRARFMSDPLEPLIPATSLAALDPLRRRLNHRLMMLEQIVQEL